MPKNALVTGIAGQDGSYLTELLLSKGYEVHGIVRRSAIEDADHKLKNISHILTDIRLHTASLDNILSLIRTVKDIQPDECYHLASSSFVSYSFDDEISILNNNIDNTHYLLATLREFSPACRIYFAGSSEMFGNATSTPQNENTPFNPRSIYGISKLAGYHLAKNYREQYKMFTCSGILYNHESPRRGYEFVTKKIVSAVAKIKLGKQNKIRLGNLEARRDWGYAPDYVYAMWLMLQADMPDDYVIASGETHTVRYFAEKAFACAGLEFARYFEEATEFYRPAEKISLSGDSTRAKKELGWCNTKHIDEIIQEMVTSELAMHME